MGTPPRRISIESPNAQTHGGVDWRSETDGATGAALATGPGAGAVWAFKTPCAHGGKDNGGQRRNNEVSYSKNQYSSLPGRVVAAATGGRGVGGREVAPPFEEPPS